MAKRGRKKKVKLQINPDAMRSIISIAMIVAACLVVIAFANPNYSVNAKILKFVKGFFGWSSFLLPFILFLGGLLYTQAFKNKFVNIKNFFGLIIFMLTISPISSLLSKNAGGIFGGTVSGKLTYAFGGAGALLILAILLGVSIVILSGKPFGELFTAFLASITSMKNKVPSKKKELVQEEIKISSGATMMTDDMDSEEKPEVTELPEPSFEVIPSLSEPKQIDIKVPATVTLAKTTPGLPYSDKVWETPPLDLLNDPSTTPIDRGDVKERAQIIVDTLRSFGIESVVKEINYGPTVTQYALEAASGVRIAKVSSLHHDLALALASPNGSVRIEAPIPGKSLIGIEVPNNTRVPVSFKEVFMSDAMKAAKSKRSIVLGKDVSGQVMIYDIARMPHLLVAGATGSGKSVFLHSIILSLLFRCSPQECQFLFLDPKRVELVSYDGIPHLKAPVIKDVEKAASVFKWAVEEMDKRYKLLEQAKVKNIDAYNERSGFQAMSYLILIADELAEIMIADPASVEKNIIRLSQLARAVGIHLILTTQRPDTSVLTGLIKGNIPCRISFNVVSNTDSRVILDQPGAEKLLGQGDMLFVPPEASKPIRIQGAWVTDKEINSVVNYLKGTGMQPEHSDDIFETIKTASKSVSSGGEQKDEFFDEAVEIIQSTGKGSASLLQRRLQIGYARAARILDELEHEGFVGPQQGSKPRDVLIKALNNSESDSLVMPNEEMKLEADTLI